MIMAEMPPLFCPPLDVTQPHNPMGYIVPKQFLLLTVAARSTNYGSSGILTQSAWDG